MHPVNIAIANITVDKPTSWGNLTVFPLISEARSPLDYLLLADCIQKDLVSVREVSEGGNVPSLVLENRADKAVLIVDGEELVGAKQNRVANISMLLPAGYETTIPVSCVEQGRWAYTSDEFSVTDNLQFARGRAEKLESVHRSIRATGTRQSDQSRVWRSISDKAEVMDARSPTSAMGSIFEHHADALTGYLEAFVPQDDQLGGLFVVGDELFGLDVFDQSATFRALLPKLVRSYAIDVLEKGTETKQPTSPSDAKAFMGRLLDASPEDHKAIGLGNDVSITAEDLIATALIVDQTVVHLTGFSHLNRCHSSRRMRETFATSGQRREEIRRRYH